MENRFPDRETGDIEKATLGSIIRELSELSAQPTDNDPRISAFAEAAYYLLSKSDDAGLRLSVEFMLDYRNDPDTDTMGGKKEEPFTAQYAANLLLRSFQHTALFIRKYPMFSAVDPSELPSYPAAFDYPTPWVFEMENILDNTSAHGVLDFDLAHRRVQSNIADRYKGPKLVILKDFPNRFSGPINVLDVGASLNLGLTKMITHMPFRPVEIVSSAQMYDGTRPEDTVASDYINSMINAQFPINHGVGIDILPMRDPNTSEWVKSCSFYPSELLDSSRTNEFDNLVTANMSLDKSNLVHSGNAFVPVGLPKLSHYTGDFSDRKSMRTLSNNLPEDKFHLVTFLTVMHQLSEREVTSMIDRAKTYLRDDGLIIVQDFVNVNHSSPNGLEFPSHWTEFMYKTCVIDPNSSDPSPREVVIWDYGRCKQAIIV